MKAFQDLQVWQRSIELAKELYGATSKLPAQETYGLQSQMRRAAVSIPSNIAEGQKRGTKRDFVHFLRIAYGSSAELQTQILIAESVYSNMDFSLSKSLLDEIQKMLSGLIRNLNATDNQQLTTNN